MTEKIQVSYDQSQIQVLEGLEPVRPAWGVEPL